MPVHILASSVSSTIPTEYWASIAAALVAISFLKTWSQGAQLLDPPPFSSSNDGFNDLHGRQVLVASGAFTPLGVVTLSSLAHRGAQIIALTPDISSPEVIQMIHLIRDSTRSELVYAEQCDMGDLVSVGAFAALWNSGDKKQQEGVRRLDALLFLPPGREELGRVRLETGGRRRYEEVYQLHVLARFHLVNSLLSGLLVQPREREVRVVSVMSPFYAAGLGHFDVLNPYPSGSKGKSQLQTLAESSFSALLGAASLRWYVLTLELQRRLDLLAEADPRPTKLAGIHLDPSTLSPSTSPSVSSTATRDEVEKRMRQHSNINIINVCPGFERTDLIDTFLPSPTSTSLLASVRSVARWLVLLVLWPVVWLLAKSPATAANSVVWATTRKLEPLSSRYERILSGLSSEQATKEEVRGWQDPLIPAEMYREGRIVRPQLPERFAKRGNEKDDAWAQLWKQEEKEVERRLKAFGGSIKRPKV